MNLNEQQELIDAQLIKVKEPILIDNVIGGDNTEVYVEFKGRSSRFLINGELGSSINKWIENLPVITINEIQQIMNKYNVSLEKISELLEDEELMEIKNIEKWVEKYNNHDCFLSIGVIDKVLKSNL